MYMSIPTIIKKIDSGERLVLTNADKSIIIYKTSGQYREKRQKETKIIKNIEHVLFKYLQHGWKAKFESNLREVLKDIK